MHVLLNLNHLAAWFCHILGRWLNFNFRFLIYNLKAAVIPPTSKDHHED